MIQKIKSAFNLVKNMGWRYTGFRVKHELLRKTGILKNKFPVQPAMKQYMTLEQWKQQSGIFFFESKSLINFKKNPSEKLKKAYEDFKDGRLLFFNSEYFDLRENYDWVTNPDSGFTYDADQHWTLIRDYSKNAGDIKYVWEKSRFSFLYDLIRYDYHFNEDCSQLVFDEILSWIKTNPVNCGPNYRCSQEISLRVLNWTFALYYYKDSPNLTKSVFEKIQYAIYWHIHHVYHHIDFSRIAVRNNHAITETLTLYLAGILYPFVADFKQWGKKGKIWFEEEVAYQVYEDGTYLQFSMNYHRVVIQLLTWAIKLAEINKDPFSPVIYNRALKSLKFLRVCMDDITGRLPDYGANDGALFFKLNNTDYRDYRCQLNALGKLLKTDIQIDSYTEDADWYGLTGKPSSKIDLNQTTYSFDKGGYYIIREQGTLTFIRCGNHNDRPSQADNLHLDIWVKGENILRDSGSYKYNAEEEIIRFFFGTASHNTIMLGNNDQMKKGKRFIWYYWTQAIVAGVTEMEEYYEFSGAIKAFQHVQPGIIHTRTVKKYKGKPKWEVQDEVTHETKFAIHQIWNPAPDASFQIDITAFNENGLHLPPENKKGWYSSGYGKKEPSNQVVYSTNAERVLTMIEVN